MFNSFDWKQPIQLFSLRIDINYIIQVKHLAKGCYFMWKENQMCPYIKFLKSHSKLLSEKEHSFFWKNIQYEMSEMKM